MLSFQQKAKELVAEDELQWKKETMGPLLKNNTGKWKGNLKVWEVALIEKLCRQAFEIGGYEYSKNFQELSVFHKSWIILFVWVFRGVGSSYMLYRYWYQKALLVWKY